VAVLTQAGDYRKTHNKLMPLIRLKYRRYPKLVEQIERRYQDYNDTLDYVRREEEAGRVLVIRPGKPVDIGRLEKDRNKLMALYQEGYEDAAAGRQRLAAFLSDQPSGAVAGEGERKANGSDCLEKREDSDCLKTREGE
jgi:predicted patatin/cPLA2 family phospholipase